MLMPGQLTYESYWHPYVSDQNVLRCSFPGLMTDIPVHPVAAVLSIGRGKPVAAVEAILARVQRGRRGREVGRRCRVDRAAHDTGRGGEDVVRARPGRHRGAIGPASGIIILDEGGSRSRVLPVCVNLPCLVCKGFD